MSSVIVPTILVPNAENFNQFLSVYKNFANRLQLDICDGEFTPTKTVSLDEISLPPDWSGTWDFHMMVSRPSRYIPAILKLHPSLVIFHAEANENLLPVFEQLSSNQIKTGVAFKKETYPGTYANYIQAADHALIFASTLGVQGAPADLFQLEKVKIIRDIDKNIEIGWDGGASLENVRAIAQSGVNVINVGSAISRAQNSKESYAALESESDKQGVNI